jgi:FkbM family methyltransferase
MINKGEIDFYNVIKETCQIVFDIGCREDIFYAETSMGKEFHLFEPNPEFYNICKNKINKIIDNKIIINNFGLGNESKTLEYYEDAQSFLKRYVQYESKSIPIYLHIKRFSEYLIENNIDHIDFLKIDTEGCEPDILKDNINFIKNNVKYVQFEYASTWMDREDKIDLWNIFEIFKDYFKFYFLFDENHPICKQNVFLLYDLNGKEDIDIIDYYIQNEYGSNIVMIRR